MTMGLYERLAQNGASPSGNGAGNGKPEPPIATVATAPHPPGEDPIAAIRRRTHQALLEAMGPKLYDVNITPDQLEARVREQLQEVLASEATPLSAADRKRLVTETMDDILGYGPLEPLLHDEDVTEIMVNGPDHVYVEREGRVTLSGVKFLDAGHLRRTIEKIVGQVGRRIDESQPFVDARLADGSRVNAIIPPVAVDGASLTIRKFAREAFEADDLVSFGTLSSKVSQFLNAAVEGHMNILVSGGTGAGKTTTLNVLSSFIPPDERIVTIEDAAELQLQQPHVVRLEYRPPNIEGRGEVTVRQLVRNALRMRPDRIIVGEVRGGEALDMLQAMNTGHDGSLTTVHANAPRDVLSRIETMTLMAGMELPVRAIREQVASAIDLIVHQSRLPDGTRRLTHVTEVVGMEGDVITLQDLFLFDYKAGRDDNGRFLGSIVPTGLRPKFGSKLADHGIELPAALFVPEESDARHARGRR
jgi:pilus assembly protein CpaF